MMVLYVLGWLVCSMLSHGIIFAFLQREYDFIAQSLYWEDFAFSCVLSLLFGPIALFSSLINCEFGLKHGLKFK